MSYYNARRATSFGGVNKHNKEYLITQDAYRLHKPVRKIFPRRKTLSYFPNDLLQVDLAELILFARVNRGIRYLLVAIDVFSKFLYVIPLKRKNKDEMLKAFKILFKKVRPRNVQTDNGTEFYNKPVKDLFKKYNINHYSTHSEMKASLAERVIQTLKNRIYRLFTYRKNKKYIDLLDDLVYSYNKSYHHSIKMAPASVRKKDIPEIYNRLYGDVKPASKSKFKVGDKVKMTHAPSLFKRGYKQGWSVETFTIAAINNTSPITFNLVDDQNEKILGKFYTQELQRVL